MKTNGQIWQEEQTAAKHLATTIRQKHLDSMMTTNLSLAMCLLPIGLTAYYNDWINMDHDDSDLHIPITAATMDHLCLDAGDATNAILQLMVAIKKQELGVIVQTDGQGQVTHYNAWDPTAPQEVYEPEPASPMFKILMWVLCAPTAIVSVGAGALILLGV